VNIIDEAAYAEDVENAVLFIEGRSQEVIDTLVSRMEDASGKLDFERAARLRDQIAKLRRVQQAQYVSSEGGDIDVVACVAREGVGTVQVFFIRGGINLGNKAFFPAHTTEESPEEILAAFLAQYYLAGRPDRPLPQQILLSHAVEDAELLSDGLSARAGRKVIIQHGVRGDRARWVAMAQENAEVALSQRLVAQAGGRERIDAFQ
jgi:excinuclease ABC subunit C